MGDTSDEPYRVPQRRSMVAGWAKLAAVRYGGRDRADDSR
jgi:hypothetical protein